MLLAAQIEDTMLAKCFSKKQSPLSKDVIYNTLKSEKY
jgi:hypothetical protein